MPEAIGFRIKSLIVAVAIVAVARFVVPVAVKLPVAMDGAEIGPEIVRLVKVALVPTILVTVALVPTRLVVVQT